MDLKDIKDPSHWHIAIAVAGLAIAVAAIAAGSKPMAIAGIGMIAFGVGEMRNHLYQEKIMQNDSGYIVGKISGHPRNPSLLGNTLDIIGVLLFFAGLIWFVAA